MTWRQLMLLTLPPLLWAGNAVVGRAMVGQVPPLALNAMRWTLALALLLPLGWKAVATADARAALRSRWRELALLSLLGVSCYNALQYLALTTSTPLNVTLIAASGPVWMLAIGAAFHDERPTRRALIGAAFSLAGVLVVIARGELAALARVRLVTGDLLMLGAVISWAFYSWQLARPAPSLRGEARPPWGWAEFVLAQTLFGVGWTWVFAAIEAIVAPAPVRWSWGVAAALAFVAAGPSVLAYRCWNGAVAAAGPATAAMFANLTPLFAALLSAALLGVWPQPFHGLAFALILLGIVVSSRRGG